MVTCISSKQRCFSSDFGALLRMLSEGNGQTPRKSGDRPSDACELRMHRAEGAEGARGPKKTSYVLFRRFVFTSRAQRLGTAEELPWGAQTGLSWVRSPCEPPQITSYHACVMSAQRAGVACGHLYLFQTALF